MKRMIMGAMVLSLAVGSLALADPPGYDQHHDEHHHVVEHHRTVVHHAHARFATGRYVRPHGYYAHRGVRVIGFRRPTAGLRMSSRTLPSIISVRRRWATTGSGWTATRCSRLLRQGPW